MQTNNSISLLFGGHATVFQMIAHKLKENGLAFDSAYTLSGQPGITELKSKGIPVVEITEDQLKNGSSPLSQIKTLFASGIEYSFLSELRKKHSEMHIYDLDSIMVQHYETMFEISA
jgi:hypothetical protein